MAIEAPARRVRLFGAILLIVAFGAGAVAGAAFTRVRTAHTLITVEANADIPQELGALHLTALQERQVRAIIEAARPRTERVLREAAPHLRAILDSVDAEVRAVLTPVQQSGLDEQRRREPVFLLKRQYDTGATRVDTLRTVRP